ncbi:MAG: hypothetical protein ACOYO0_07275 [Sandarakinorhabdus sp.]
MSTPLERLEEVYAAFSSALQRRPADLKQATTEAQVIAVLGNVRSLEASFLKAASAALKATGAEVEAALRDAKAVRADVEAAYQAAKDLSEKIRLVSRSAKAVGELVKKAQS